MNTSFIFELMFGSLIAGISALIFMEVRRSRKNKQQP
jgi:hypothetical protein